MNGIFGLDGPFVKYGSLFADIVIISVLFIITSIPIITIGASTTAMYYVMTRRIYEKEAYVIKDYFKSFKENFKQSTIISIVLNLAIAVLTFNIFNINMITNSLSMNNKVGIILVVIYLFLLIECTIISLYVYPLLSRFHYKTWDAVKTSLLLAHKHLPTTITVVALYVTTVYLTLSNPFLILISIGGYACLNSYFLMKVFKKYRPELDEYLDETSYEERAKIDEFYKNRRDNNE